MYIKPQYKLMTSHFPPPTTSDAPRQTDFLTYHPDFRHYSNISQSPARKTPQKMFVTWKKPKKYIHANINITLALFIEKQGEKIVWKQSSFFICT